MSRLLRSAVLAVPLAFSGPFSCVDRDRAIPGPGELSQSSQRWLSAAAGQGEQVEHLVAKGTQLAPVALEMSKLLDDSVDKEVTIEPIYQALADEAAQRELDEKLAQMPKTRQIEGVSVGFKQLAEISNEKKVDETAYLVIWRRDDHLVGFIYRSRREIDLDKLADEAPRLIRLVDAALSAND